MKPETEISELIADVREQVLYMKELGIDAFDAGLFASVGAMHLLPTAERQPTPSPTVIPVKLEQNTAPDEPKPSGVSRLASLPSLSARIPPKKPEMPQTSDNMPKVQDEPTALAERPQAADTNTDAIMSIRSEIGPDCTRCKLATLGRSRVVNSVGNFSARLMFVGEAPGADEDEQGEPFVGRAGQLLTDIIEKGLQIPRKDVFIGNINRCRPPGNRAPEPDETVACKPFLLKEIAVVQPKVIVVLGATAAHNLLETKVPIGKLRGQFHDYQGSKVMPTFHPAYLLRDPHKKREVWEDMKMVRDYLAFVE